MNYNDVKRIFSTAVALSSICSAVLSGQAVRLSAVPQSPEPGAIVRLTLTTPTGADPVVSVHGTLAGEPLHFMRASGRAWHAIGGVAVEAEESPLGTPAAQLASRQTAIAPAPF